MKITENITVYSGGNGLKEAALNKQEHLSEKSGKGSVYVGTMNDDLLQNNILQRKKEAQEKAMKVIGDAFAADRSIDEDLQSRRMRVEELTAENKELREQLKAVSEQQEQLKEQYGITEDLEISEYPEEYQQRYQELGDLEDNYREVLQDNEQIILEENAIIRGTRLERLKNSPMGKAQKQAEEILESASEDIVSMVYEDAKEHIEEEAEQREKKAEKLEEKRQEQEALVEKQQEKREEQEELLENMPTDELLELNHLREDVQQEVQNIVNKMKLVAEDIKGAAVDSTI